MVRCGPHSLVYISSQDGKVDSVRMLRCFRLCHFSTFILKLVLSLTYISCANTSLVCTVYWQFLYVQLITCHLTASDSRVTIRLLFLSKQAYSQIYSQLYPHITLHKITVSNSHTQNTTALQHNEFLIAIHPLLVTNKEVVGFPQRKPLPRSTANSAVTVYNCGRRIGKDMQGI